MSLQAPATWSRQSLVLHTQVPVCKYTFISQTFLQPHRHINAATSIKQDGSSHYLRAEYWSNTCTFSCKAANWADTTEEPDLIQDRVWAAPNTMRRSCQCRATHLILRSSLLSLFYVWKTGRWDVAFGSRKQSLQSNQWAINKLSNKHHSGSWKREREAKKQFQH